VKSQEPCPVRKPFIFWWLSWHATTTTEPEGNWWDWRIQLPWTISSNVLVHLVKTQMNTREPLIRTFNTLD